FHLVQRIADRAGKIARLRAREQVDDDFRVAIGLENRTAMLELAAPLRGVGKVAVMPESNFSLVAIDQYRLRIEQRFVASRGIPGVADRRVPGKRVQHAGRENFFYLAHRAM